MSFTERKQEVTGRIIAACKRVGRDPSRVRLLAVSKAQPVSALDEAYACGQQMFGENYVQELKEKAAHFGEVAAIQWHFIGALQTNKVKYIIPFVACIHSVDSEKLMLEIDKRARAHNRRIRIMIEVNIADEPQKAGCTPQEARALFTRSKACEFVNVIGLMTVPPAANIAEESRIHFKALKQLADELNLSEISMGMSHDFEIAIEEGATIVRVGTALFGARH